MTNSGLYLTRSPTIMYPLTPAIDHPLPAPKKRMHQMLEHKPACVQVQLLCLAVNLLHHSILCNLPAAAVSLW